MPDSTHHTAEVFDALVLGSGEAGKYLSWSLGAQGKRVALIERRYVGGSCPNIACLPSKNIVHSAKVAWYAQRLDEFGMNKPTPGIDMAVVRERKRAMVRGLVDVHEKRFAANHVVFVNGEGRFVGPRTLSVALPEGGTRLLKADIVIVSTGSRAVIPDIPGLRASQPMTHVEELELDTLPGHLLVLGGGYVGLEFAQAMARFGSRVTVINRGERLLTNEDEDVTAALAEVLAKEANPSPARQHLGIGERALRGLCDSTYTHRDRGTGDRSHAHFRGYWPSAEHRRDWAWRRPASI